MPYPDQALAPPSHIAVRLPQLSLLQEALIDNAIELPPGFSFRRAAWNPASVWPAQVMRTYRFGPPDVLMDLDGRYPFHWVYIADHPITAAWEAGFCANDVTRPGTFYVAPHAEDALLATLQFDRPIRLLDLAGTAASKLRIYDDLRSPDYEWSQWFGTRLDQLIAAQNGQVHGFRYPSRRHPGYDAFTISSRVIAALACSRTDSVVRFGDTAEYAMLMRDVCCVAAP